MYKIINESRINQFLRQNKSLSGIIILILVMSMVYAVTTITDTNVNSPTGTYVNITASQINNVFYVQAGNASDIQKKIDLCNGWCKIIVPKGDYDLVNTINLTSNLTFEINQGAEIHADSVVGLTIFTDLQLDTSNALIYANNLDNLNFYNYGLIGDANINHVLFLNNSRKVDIRGGFIRGSYGIYNSRFVNIEEIFVPDEYFGQISMECTIDSTINGMYSDNHLETIDLNGGNERITISNIHTNGSSKSQMSGSTTTGADVIDLGGSRDIVMNNIQASNVAFIVDIHSDLNPNRWCGGWNFELNNIYGSEMTCFDCNTSFDPITLRSPLNSFNYSMEVNGITYGNIEFPSMFEVSNQGLILAMNFNNESISGITVLDSSGKNIHGTVFGAIHNGSDGFNNGGNYEFDGIDDYISIDDHGEMNFTTGSFTLSAWVKTNSILPSNGYIIERRDTYNAGYRFLVKGGNDIQFTIENSSGSNLEIETPSNNLLLDKWHQIVAVRDAGNKLKLYIDGVLIKEIDDTITGSIGQNVRNVNIGRGGAFGSTEFFNGSIDNVIVYNRALSNDEIEALYKRRVEADNSYVSQKDIQVDSSGNVKITNGILNMTDNNISIRDSVGTEYSCGVNLAGVFTCG